MALNREELPAKMDVSTSSKQLKIAIVYSRMPFPMMRGDQLTVSHLIQYLSKRGHEVTLYTTDLDGELSEVQETWLKSACAKINVFRVKKITRLVNLVRGFLKLLPLQVGYFYSYQLEEKARADIKNGDYDIVYTYYLRSAPVVDGLFSSEATTVFGETKTASFLAMQLSQTLNTYRILKNEKNLFSKMIYFLEWRLLRRYESRIWQRFTNTLLIGQKDVGAVEDACVQEGQQKINNWFYGAHGTDVRKFRAAEVADVVPGRVVFSGSMLYQPNVQAVQWFVETCWPLIRKQYPASEFYIVGRDPVRQITELDGIDGIKVTGTVPDVGEYIRTANVCINPMLAAGGMQNKLIEYMACAKAIVATTVANEGIGASHNDSIFVADDANAFTSGVCRLLASERECNELGSRAREFVLKNWTWEAHFNQLESNFFNALSKDEQDTKKEELKRTVI
ncbi:MAG: glycosyltransferase family 4 protein [Colwellia sp.]|jgi:Glycosyltransferase